MTAESVKCPTCARPKGVACIRLAAVPGGRIIWVSSEAHDARRAKVRG